MNEAVAENSVYPGGYDVFICYNAEDEKQALRLKAGLQSGHLRVFEASSSLRPGDTWLKQLSAVISSAKAALVLLGKAGAERWAELELEELLHEYEKRKMRIIPVLVSGASNNPDVPWLRAFERVDLRSDYEARLGALRATLGDVIVDLPDTRLERLKKWLKKRRVKAGAAILAAALVAGGAVGGWHHSEDVRQQAEAARRQAEAARRQAETARRQAELAGKIDAIVKTSDWGAVKEMAGAGPPAVRPIDDRLLAHYRGQGTTDAVSVLLDIARNEPDEVCPSLAKIVDLRAPHGYPLLTVEEVLSQIVHSPCGADRQVQSATAGAAKEVRAALASPDAFEKLKEQIDPRLDCAGLERLRRLLSIPGPAACSAPASREVAGP